MTKRLGIVGLLIITVSVSSPYAHEAKQVLDPGTVLTDDFENGSLDQELWSIFYPAGQPVKVDEQDGELHMHGYRRCVGVICQVGVEGRYYLSPYFNYYAEIRFRDIWGYGHFKMEFHSVARYYHISLVCGEDKYRFYVMYEGVSRGEAFTRRTLPRNWHSMKISYDSTTNSMTGVVDDRRIGRLTLPAPMDIAILRIVVGTGHGLPGNRIDICFDDFVLAVFEPDE